MMRDLSACVATTCVLAFASGAMAQPYGGDTGLTEAQWERLEAPLLSGHTRLTSRDRFLKAGEAYFDPTSSWIIFQAIEADEGGEHYSMYVAKLARDDAGKITGIEEPMRISEPGSANTCGWFHPTIPGLVLFGSTIAPPNTESVSGYDSGRYRWAFPAEMEVVVRYIPEIARDAGVEEVPDEYAGIVDQAEPLFERPGYTAEASWSPDGRYVVYTHGDADESQARRPDMDIWIYDTRTGEHTALVTEIGYDGGPFFSPDGSRICYRSDRRRDSMLQLYVKDLVFDAAGNVSPGAEHAITANDDVNWAPFWHPSGELLIYASSEMGHRNYEVFSIEVDTEKNIHDLRQRRITRTFHADILPVFNADGTLMMWTAQRGMPEAGESKPSSQLWVARVNSSITPEVWFRKIDEADAVRIAREEVTRREGAAWAQGELELNPRRDDGHVWRVVVWLLPKAPGHSRMVELAADGTVLRYIVPD